MTNGFTTINLLLDADCVIGKNSVPLRLEDDTTVYVPIGKTKKSKVEEYISMLRLAAPDKPYIVVINVKGTDMCGIVSTNYLPAKPAIV